VVETDEDGVVAIFFGVEHSLLPEAVIADELAVDPGLADPQVGLGLEFVSALESASFFPKISSSHLKSITSSLDFHYDHSRTC